MRILLLCLSVVSLLGCALGREMRTEAATTALPSALEQRLDLGRVILLGQPNPEDLRLLRDEGVVDVINLRTQGEIDALGDAMHEPELAASLGLGYHHVPVGGSSGWSEDATNALAQALSRSDGRVLLHCASGARAGLVHAAYRIRDDKISPMDAMREVEATGVWPLSLEKLSGVPLRLERADSEPDTVE